MLSRVGLLAHLRNLIVPCRKRVRQVAVDRMISMFGRSAVTRLSLPCDLAPFRDVVLVWDRLELRFAQDVADVRLLAPEHMLAPSITIPSGAFEARTCDSVLKLTLQDVLLLLTARKAGTSFSLLVANRP